MKMSIDESKKQLVMQKSYALGENYEAIEVALETMRKYQKIKQLIADYEEYKWERIAVKDIREIIDGNVD